jgi:hypothetical protein
MNINLRDVVCTSREGDRFWRMPECYIRGNTIKYLCIAKEVIDKVPDEPVPRANGMCVLSHNHSSTAATHTQRHRHRRRQGARPRRRSRIGAWRRPRRPRRQPLGRCHVGTQGLVGFARRSVFSFARRLFATRRASPVTLSLALNANNVVYHHSHSICCVDGGNILKASQHYCVAACAVSCGSLAVAT